MFKSHFLSGEEKKKSFYKVYSNKLTKPKTLSKKLYYISKFDECQKDARKVWNVIRSTLPKSKPIIDTPDSLPSQQCYAGPMRVLRGLPVREPYRFGRGRCSGPAWVNRTGLIWLSILSHNQKLKHANTLTFFIIF